MRKVNTCYYELEGTHYEIGRQMAKLLGKDTLSESVPDTFTHEEFERAIIMLDQYCPGLTDELRGFSDENEVSLKENFYLWMNYLMPRCSSMVLLPPQTDNGHTLIARNYEFGIENEDFHVYRVAPTGKYAHIGGSMLEFGRSEGMNECGLAVSMSSCGFPVSNFPGMRAPAIIGLNFFVVLRSLLDNCKDVEEALALIESMPIAYNINLILADRNQNIALVETMNGEKAIKRGGIKQGINYLCATNHIVIEEFKNRESMAMRNSLERHKKIQSFIQSTDQISEQQLKNFLLAKYPEGMTAWYYKDYFGTVKSVIMDVEEGRFSICWGGRNENGWDDYYVNKKLGNQKKEIEVIEEEGDKEFFEFIPF